MDDSVALGTSSLLNPTAAITVAFWMKGTDNNGVIIGRYDDSFAGSSWLVWSNGAGALRWYTSNGIDVGGTNTLVSNGNPYDGAWHHVVVTWQTGANNKNIYIDGVLDTTGTHSVTLGSNATQTRIGLESTPGLPGGGTPLGGMIDEVRIYNRALSASEVAKLYQSGAVRINASSADLDAGSSLESGLVGHWTFDGKDTQSTITDRSVSGNHGYFRGSATSSAKVIGTLGQALTFNGSNNDIEIPSSATLSTQSLTMTAWVKLPSPIPSGWRAILSHDGGGSNYYGLWKSDNGNIFACRISPDIVNDFTTVLQPNTWYFVACTHNEPTGATVWYVNGVQDGTNSEASGTANNAVTYIGSDLGVQEFFSGTLDEVRIYNRALTASEVKQLYNLGKAKIGQ